MPSASIAHIAIDSSIRGGRPHLEGSRVTVANVVLMHVRLGQPLEEIAGRYELAMGALHAAMAYYYDHREEIDRDHERDAAFQQAFAQRNPSALQEKLAALGRGD